MNKLVLAATAVMMSAGVSSAGSLEVSNACIVGHGVSTLTDGREVVDLDSVNEMIACMIAEEAEKTAKETDRVVTYIAAWEEAKAKVIELIYEIAVLEAKLDDVDYGQNTQIQQLAQYNADLKAELDSTKIKLAALNVELQAANAPNESDEIVAGIQQVVSNHKKRAGDNFANDPVGYMQFAFNYLEDRQADLRRAEDRIRELEKELKHHRSGGYWNPTNW